MPTASASTASIAHPVRGAGLTTRRAFIRLSAQGALAASVGAPLLLAAAACAPTAPRSTVAPTTPPSGSTSSVQLPVSAPFNGPKPDLPGTDQGVTPAFFSYPQNPVKSVPTPPGKGG